MVKVVPVTNNLVHNNVALFSKALNELVLRERELNGRSYLSALDKVEFSNSDGLSRIALEFTGNVRPEYRHWFLRRLRAAFKELLSAFETGTLTNPKDLGHFISNRRSFEQIIAKRLNQEIADKGKSVKWKFSYLVLEEKGAGNSELYVSITCNYKELPAVRLQHTLDKLLKGTGVNAVVSRSGARGLLDINEPLVAQRQMINFGNSPFSKLSSGDFFISMDTERPLVTIDNDNTYRMEDAIFVRRLSSVLSYCSVYMPVRLTTQQRYLRPHDGVIALGVEFLFNRQSALISEAQVGLSSVVSQARLTYSQVERYWEHLKDLPQLFEHYKAEEIVRNLQDSLEVAGSWVIKDKRGSSQKAESGGLMIIDLNKASPGNLIVVNLIEMAQIAVAQFLHKSGYPFISLVTVPTRSLMQACSEQARHFNFSGAKEADHTLKDKFAERMQQLVEEAAQPRNGPEYIVVNPSTMSYEDWMRGQFKTGWVAEVNQRQILAALNPAAFPAHSLAELSIKCEKERPPAKLRA